MTKATQKKLLQAIETCKGMLASTGWSAASWFPVQQQMNRLQKMLPEDAGSVTEIITSLQQALQALSEKMDTDTAQETRELVSDLLTAAADRVASLPVKKLFVFLPYKASMWDSLESIWRAAAADKEHCETLVIPIPYCNLSADHKPLQWHVETNLFPKDVPVTSYDAVNLEDLHPDAIFVHNPYDQYNRVTSVDSRYYTSHLKDLTDCLVYVPYYVSELVTGMNFCRVPGVIHADLVIAQDRINQKKFEREYPLGVPPSGKFLPLGSPKLDQVIRARKENFQLPADWQRITHKKKIFLYNTSINATLQHPEKVCVKLRELFQQYREDEEWAFWWRPHPLLKATLKSMLPTIYDEYCQLEEMYRRERWGVYDDTSNLQRAIAYGDIYYGDHSSVIPLFLATGKPVVLQDFDYINHPGKIPAWTSAIASDGENLWFVEGNLNVLMRYTPRTKKFICMGKLPGEKLMQEDAYLGIAYAVGKIFLLPYTGDNFLVYHIQEKRFSKIPYPDQADYARRLYHAFVFEHWIYCTPSEDYPYILRVDCEREIIDRLIDVRSIFSSAGVPAQTFISMASRFDYDHLILAADGTTKSVLFDMRNLVSQIVDVGNAVSDFQMNSSVATEHSLFLSSRGTSAGILVIDKKNMDVRTWIRTDYCFLCPLNSHYILAYNQGGRWIQLGEDGKTVQGEIVSRGNGAMQSQTTTFSCVNDGEHVYVFDTHASCLYSFNQEGKLYSINRISLFDAENLPPAEEWYHDAKIFEFPGLDLKRLYKKHRSISGRIHQKNLAGIRIYQEVCRYLDVGQDVWQASHAEGEGNT